jgi:Leucine-rich repeat (LRR) protein
MDQEKALKTLWGRALHNMQQSHRHNLANPLPQKQCLICGGQGRRQETALEEHIFCSGKCQGTLWKMDHCFSLGMKRGLVAVKEKRRFPRIIVPMIGIKDLPDELIWELFTWAYRFRLLSVEEFNELLEMRTVSPQFLRVIDGQVIPGIQFLCGQILRVITPGVLLRFTGLETMLFGKAPKNDAPFPQLTYSLLPNLVHLKKLVISNDRSYSDLLSADALGHLKRLETLELVRVLELDEEEVAELVTVRELTLSSCALTEKSFETLPLLERLVLEGHGENMKSLNRCKALRELSIGKSFRMTDASIDQLINLTSLSLPGDSHRRTIGDATLRNLPQLRILDISDNLLITDAGVSQLVNLERLVMRGNSSVTTDAVMQLTQLVSLDMSQQMEMFPLEVHLLTNLTELFAWNVHFGGNGVLLPASLTTLELSHNSLHEGYLSTLPNLTSLYVGTCKHLLDRDLQQLTQLRVLDLSHNKRITDEGLEGLLNLTELILHHSWQITYASVRKLAKLEHLLSLHSNLEDKDVAELRGRGVLVFDHLSVKGLDPFPPHFRDASEVELQ